MTIDLSAAIASTRDTWTLTDNSTFTPSRSSFYVYVNGYKVNYANALTDLLVSNATPNTSTSWSITYSVDGAYRVYYVALEGYSGVTPYAQYDAVYDGGVVYRSLQDSNTGNDVADTSWWEVIPDPATLAANKGEANESLNIDTLVYNRVFSADGQYAYDNLIAGSTLCSDCDEAVVLAKYNLFALWLDDIAIADAREEVLTGELIARKIQSVFIDCV